MKSTPTLCAVAVVALLASTLLAQAQGTSGSTGAVASIPSSVVRGAEQGQTVTQPGLSVSSSVRLRLAPTRIHNKRRSTTVAKPRRLQSREQRSEAGARQIPGLEPGKDNETNWLPAKTFNLTMRIYSPQSDALTGKWSPPAVKKAGMGASSGSTSELSVGPADGTLVSPARGSRKIARRSSPCRQFQR